MQNLSYLDRFGAGQYFMEIFLAPASCVVRPRNLSEPISLAIQPAGLRLSLANLTQALTQAHHHSAVGLNNTFMIARQKEGSGGEPPYLILTLETNKQTKNIQISSGR